MKCEIFHINQDHVSVLPENAQLIGHSELCENSVFVIGDSVLALQGHPEQPRRAMENFIKELFASRRKSTRNGMRTLPSPG
jgi:GMP synthase - Glutamine amidotransferase domain